MPHTSYSVFADESGVRERFLLYGGIFLPSDHVERAEEHLGELCARSGFLDREMSWKKCSPGKVARYCAFAEAFWALNEAVPPVDFRALVIDTHRNPLQDPEHGCDTAEDGFYKFYHFFISRGLQQLRARSDHFALYVASASDQYPYRAEILTSTVGGTLKQHFGDNTAVTEVERSSPKQMRLHQLADVLVGAVSYRYNRNDSESEKAQIAEAIEQRVGKVLTADFFPNERPFNVWAFAPLGGRRWTPGSRGKV